MNLTESKAMCEKLASEKENLALSKETLELEFKEFREKQDFYELKQV